MCGTGGHLPERGLHRNTRVEMGALFFGRPGEGMLCGCFLRGMARYGSAFGVMPHQGLMGRGGNERVTPKGGFLHTRSPKAALVHPSAAELLVGALSALFCWWGRVVRWGKWCTRYWGAFARPRAA